MTNSKEVSTLPNLLVIGAQKAGSTWLHERLAIHPDVFMSEPKELRFFGNRDKSDSEQSLAGYRLNFLAGEKARYRGESTPAYFWSHDPKSPYGTDLKRSNLDIPAVVARTLDNNIPLILSLRNPVSRAISAFYHHYKAGNISPEDTLKTHGHRWGIIDMGFYQRHIEAWLAHFDRGQLHVVLFDDIVQQPEKVTEKLYRSLGLSTGVHDPELRKRSNQGGKRSVDKQLFNTDSIKLDQGTGPRISAADIDFLSELYKDDITYVENHLSRALPSWRSRQLADYL
ncbi:MAG: sulfotransferase domain-containing protein [Halioglobus sp.]